MKNIENTTKKTPAQYYEDMIDLALHIEDEDKQSEAFDWIEEHNAKAQEEVKRFNKNDNQFEVCQRYVSVVKVYSQFVEKFVDAEDKRANLAEEVKNKIASARMKAKENRETGEFKKIA